MAQELAAGGIASRMNRAYSPDELTPQTAHRIAAWLVLVAVLVFAMVIVGGITRLTESGLSITSWKPVTGIIPPLTQAGWEAEFAQYQKIPQYRDLNAGMSLADFKSIYFWEFSHRLLARIVGTVALLPPLFLVLRGTIGGALALRYLAVSVLVLLQGVLGWFMVRSGLSERDLVSQYWLTAHLLLATSLYGYAVWEAANLLSPLRRPANLAAHCHFRLPLAAKIVTGLVFITMMAGGFTAGLHAGLVYNSFPLMDGRLMPADYLALSPWWRNPFENVAAVQFDHRLLAMTTLAAVVAFWIKGRIMPALAYLRPRLNGLLAMVCIQVTLGISTLLLVVPVPLAVAHQASALLLFTMAVLCLHGLRRPKDFNVIHA